MEPLAFTNLFFFFSGNLLLSKTVVQVFSFPPPSISIRSIILELPIYHSLRTSLYKVNDHRLSKVVYVIEHPNYKANGIDKAYLRGEIGCCNQGLILISSYAGFQSLEEGEEEGISVRRRGRRGVGVLRGVLKDEKGAQVWMKERRKKASVRGRGI